jgi:hypothetical protein
MSLLLLLLLLQFHKILFSSIPCFLGAKLKSYVKLELKKQALINTISQVLLLKP